MTILYSCLCFVSISRGLMTKPVGFLRVPPLKFIEQIVWFFSFLISLLFGLFFSAYICVWFYLLQSNCNNGCFSRTSCVSSYLILSCLTLSSKLASYSRGQKQHSYGVFAVSCLKNLRDLFFWNLLDLRTFWNMKGSILYCLRLNVPAGIFLIKVNNRNTRARCEICSKLTIKILEQRQASFWYLYC